jgi:hypothetical protein
MVQLQPHSRGGGGGREAAGGQQNNMLSQAAYSRRAYVESKRRSEYAVESFEYPVSGPKLTVVSLHEARSFRSKFAQAEVCAYSLRDNAGSLAAAINLPRTPMKAAAIP